MYILLKKSFFLLSLTWLLVYSCCCILTGCHISGNWWEKLPDASFDAKCVTTEDGFKYYEDKNIGICILAFPDGENIVVPEYIDEKPVVQLGYTEMSTGVLKHHVIDGSNVKKLTLQHNVTVHYISLPKLDTLVYVDVVNFFDDSSETIKIYNRIDGVHISLNPNVELKRGNHQIDFTKSNLTTIEIPKYVTMIEAGVFFGLKNVIIKTSYESKPDGWAEGWNGNCEVEWGVSLSN